MIRQICFCCKAYLGSLEAQGNDEELISHGVCRECFPRLLAGSGQQFEELLNSLPAPVFVVGHDGSIVTANARGQKIVANQLGEIKGSLGGEVFCCKYSELPGGCGQTIHCRSCTIRITVTSTFEDGKPRIRVPAYMDLGDITGLKTIRFLISTEKVDNIVLLRIDDVQPAYIEREKILGN